MPKTFLAFLLFFFAGFQGAKFGLENRRRPRNTPTESKRRISGIYYEFDGAVPLVEEGLGAWKRWLGRGQTFGTGGPMG
jgi:hypothetical protein